MRAMTRKIYNDTSLQPQSDVVQGMLSNVFRVVFVSVNTRRICMEISKKDWKLFREKLAGWQENYMDQLTKDYIALLSADDRNASDKFWE